MRRFFIAAIVAAGVVVVAAGSAAAPARRGGLTNVQTWLFAIADGTGSIAVAGNRLVDANGQTVRLLGVNLSGAEYACIENTGFFDTPTDDRQITLITSWRVNVVRVPLNEDCWLGIHAPRRYSGGVYRAKIHELVARLHRHGLYVILDLHWNAPDGERATGLRRLADRDHSPAFWRSLARSFRSDHALLFDLYNEPHDITWRCWRDGCRLRGPYHEADDREPRSFDAAGMQRLVNAVRSTGARQPLLLGGNAWANNLSAWQRYLPRDPRHQLVASVHVYNFTECNRASCWDRTIGPVAARYPVVSGEIGEDDCNHGFVDRYMAWADAHAVSYLAWQWGAFDCRSGPSLVSDYNGTPTQYGAGVRQHLLEIAPRQ